MPFTASLVFVLLTALVFVHFTTFGARTFVIRALDNGADYGMASFASGILVTQLTWVFHRMSLYGTIAGVVLLVCSMTLYEWARRSVRGRGLSVGLSERVPDAVFEGGPYAYIRHPFYVSYMLRSLQSPWLYLQFGHSRCSQPMCCYTYAWQSSMSGQCLKVRSRRLTRRTSSGSGNFFRVFRD